MHKIFNRARVLVKDRPVLLTSRNHYDICDPDSGEVLLECREDHLGVLTRMLRVSPLANWTPLEVEVREPGKENLLTIRRGWGYFVSTVDVLDQSDRLLGRYDRKPLSTQDAKLTDAGGRDLCILKGELDEVNFTAPDGTVCGQATSVQRVRFHNRYELKVSSEVPPDHALRPMLVAGVICFLMTLGASDRSEE